MGALGAAEKKVKMLEQQRTEVGGGGGGVEFREEPPSLLGLAGRRPSLAPCLLLLGHHGGHHGDHRTICPWERDLPPHSGLLFLNQFPCLQGSLRRRAIWGLA